MERFHILDDAAVIIRSKGIYRQCKVYYRGDHLYAGVGTGFVKLLSNPGTSNPSISWDDLDAPHRIDRLGRPMLGRTVQIEDRR